MTQPTLSAHQINVESYGEGARKVVALHCALGRAASWKPFGQRFGGDICIKAPDLPGHGKSAPWSNPEPLRDISRAIVDELAGDEQIDLVGHSYGGLVALEYATRFSHKVRSLTLIEPIYLAVAGRDNRPVLDAYLAQMQPHVEALSQSNHAQAAALFLDTWGSGVEFDDLPAPVREGLIRQIPIVAACEPGDETGAEEQLTLEGLKALTMPVSLIYGEQTLPVVKQGMQGLKQRLPDAQLLEVPAAGHMVPITHTEAVAMQLESFWKL